MRTDAPVCAALRLPFALLLLLGAGSAAMAAAPQGTELQAAGGQNLVCAFKAVQTGQFQNLSYITGPVGGTLILRFASSSEDSAAGRAALIGEDKAAVVALVVEPEQTLYVDTGTAGDASMMALFTASRESAGTPAAYSRQVMVGRIPVVSQYAGTCTAQ